MDQSEAIIREYIDACNEGDLERAFAILDPAVEFHEAAALPGAISAVGSEQVHRYLERFPTYWSRFHWEPLDIRVLGDRALMRARLQLEGRSSGVKVDREWFYVFTVRDGKLLRQEGYDDIASANTALEAEST